MSARDMGGDTGEPTPDQVEAEEKKGPIEISSDELKIFGYSKVDSQELLDLMELKEIEFDTGMIEIKVDGKIEEMNTSSTDFGTTKVKPKS